MNIRLIIACSLLFSISSSLFADQDAQINIDPGKVYFGTTQLGGQSETSIVTITNLTASTFDLTSAASLQGDASQYEIVNDGCANQTLQAFTLLSDLDSCEIQVRFTPTTFGTKLAFLTISTSDVTTPVLTAFLSNEEDDLNQAKRRLPATLTDVTYSEPLIEGNAISWTIISYEPVLTSTVAVFDCTGEASGECGSSFTDEDAGIPDLVWSAAATSGQSTSAPIDPDWFFYNEQAYRHSFSVNLPADAFDGSSDTAALASGTSNVVVRFYSKGQLDNASNTGSVSVLSPGNLGATYYDSSGRRLSSTASN